jgi:tetratricopeptide (TPR) repeat protein
MVYGGASQARDLLESGSYKDAAEMFLAVGELPSAARAFVCAKDYFRAAECYERALKPLDAARLYLQIRHWHKAAELYSQAGDSLRSELALEQLKREQETMLAPGPGRPSPAPIPSGQTAPAAPTPPEKPAPATTPPAPQVIQVAAPAPPPPPPETPWPPGEVWKAMQSGDTNGAVQLYLIGGSRSGWELLQQATSPESLRALAETLFQARDHAVAAEAFRKTGETLRSAQCLSLAGLNEEAADMYARCGQRTVAAQHLEKARAWEQAAMLYAQENMFLEAARCHEKDDDPVKAAALFLKAKKTDLALPLLQSVAPSHRSFGQCRLLAGKILFQKSQKDLAVSMLAPLLQGALKTDDDLETYYQVATLMEQGGVADRAREAYQRLQETRFDFKDVTQRLGKLIAASASPPAAPPAAQARPQPSEPPVDLSPLQDCSLLNRLGLEDLRRLWMIGRTGECTPGQVLLKAGQVSQGLIIVLSGGLTITPDPSNPSVAAGFLGPGDYVGLGSLIQGPPQPNALVAQKGTRLLLLPAKALENLLSAEPVLGMHFFRSVSEHLVQTLMAEKARPPRP